ncbi:MAG: hypothetical protein ING91_19480 [Rhodocyclaceae bacterium]|nr:hypothetical protein [Rhodocyclaceae bacterium]MCA3116417.1 hypothetical protein [Rhodocyclaceae bacterium]
MAVWKDFLPETMRLCPSAPRVVALTQIKEACIDFFQRSRCWRVDLPQAVVPVSTTTFSPTPPTDTEVVDIMSAQWEERPITIKSRQELDDEFSGWRSLLPANRPLMLTLTDERTVRLVPMNTAAGALDIYAAIKPARSATGIADNQFSEHKEAIAAGAAYRLLMMPEKSWTNFELAAERLSTFRDAVRKARNLAKRGYARSNNLYAPSRRYGGL